MVKSLLSQESWGVGDVCSLL